VSPAGHGGYAKFIMSLGGTAEGVPRLRRVIAQIKAEAVPADKRAERWLPIARVRFGSRRRARGRRLA
jgi:hypothetical protein